METVQLNLHKLGLWLVALLPNDAFTTLVMATITAFAGAFAGGYAAQKVAQRNKLLNDVVNEMRAVNASISVTFAIVNTLLNMKEQHVQPLMEEYDAAKDDFDAVYEQGGAGYTAETQYTFPADLQTLKPPFVPIEPLQDLLFKRTSVADRPLNLVSLLAQTFHSLGQLLTERNEYISASRDAPPEIKRIFPLMFFGKRLPDGNLDERYPSYVYGIYQHTDDCIMYCKFLIEDLEKHGGELKDANKKRFRKQLPNVHKIDLSIAVEKGLIPNEADYRDIINSFKKRAESS